MEQIIALGGGGFSMEESPLLDDYILAASQKDRPKICFVPTASGESENYLIKFYRRFGAANCQATDLSLFRRRIPELVDFACSQDIIYVGGGNTANMLAIWKLHGFDLAVKEALKSGTVLAGLSAGSICWFEQGVTDSYGLDLTLMDCLGFLPGSHCPHYDGEAKRRPRYHELMQGDCLPGYAVDDSAGLHFIDGQLTDIVSSQVNAKAYEVGLEGSEVVETALETRFLGA
ncbi:MAG: peptidase E [Planctomycetota bacterium]|nr:peptidase E [Planctomycetota bacterium]